MQFSFPVEENLLRRVQSGDLEALFQAGLRVFLAQQFEEATTIFQEAQQKQHPLAKTYLDIAAARLSKSPTMSDNKTILNP